MTTVSTPAGSVSQPAAAAGWFERSLPGLLAFSLILTGTAGLMYQVAWFRVLGQIFGVTVQATSAVLAAFMAGLALGSLVAAQVTTRMRNPVRFYGWAEIVIGVFGILSLIAFDAMLPAYAELARTLGETNPALAPARFIVALLIMLIPTTMMGATLPIVITATQQRASHLAKHVSLLYGANTFGAIAGAFLAGFFLIGSFGITTTVALAAILNLVIGVLWLALSYGPLKMPGDARHHDPIPQSVAIPDPEIRLDRLTAIVLLVGYGFSGGISLAAEVVWTRLLAGVFPGTTYSFSIMLCCMLAGIAIGSWLANPFLERRTNWLLVFVVLELCLALAAIFCLVLLGQLYSIEPLVRGIVGGTELLYTRPWFLVAFAVLAIGPFALLLGITFPVAAKLYAAGHPDPGRRVGLVYGANTLGAIAGALAGGLLLIPLLGAQGAMWVLAAGNLAIGLVVLTRVRMPAPQRLGLAGAAGAIALLAALVVPPIYGNLDRTNREGMPVIWVNEGPDATVRVVTDPAGTRVLYIDSEHQGVSAGAGADFHHRIGHWGAILHPEPRSALVVGLGVGATPGAVALHPDTQVQVVELYPGVVAAAPLFQDVNYGLLDRPNVRVDVSDGRNFLLLTDQRFDLIQADPIRPYNAGAGNLYSADFYRLAKEHLAPGGLMVQWMDTSLSDDQYRVLLRTFLSVFPDATLWNDGQIVVGGLGDRLPTAAEITPRLQDPEVAASLAGLGIRSGEDVLAQFSAGPEQIRAWVGEGPVITDRTPWVEFFWTRAPDPNTSPRPEAWLPR